LSSSIDQHQAQSSLQTQHQTHGGLATKELTIQARNIKANQQQHKKNLPLMPKMRNLENDHPDQKLKEPFTMNFARDVTFIF
jgi:hypothetical protein